MLLKLDNVVAGYDGGDVLKGVNLEIEPGSTTCIVGPNGAGKSTLLRVISGLLKPRRGSLTFDGRSIVGMSPRYILELGIVQVPQEHSLFPEMTVRENIILGGFLLHGKARKERRYHEILESFPGVRERANEQAGSLSGGQQRLVEIVRSLMLNPTLVLLDEPSMGLAPKTLKQVLEMVMVLQVMGKTVLLVEQNVRSGLSIATHGVVMENGQVRLLGTSAQILSNPEISHLYLGGTLSGA
jgi:ABC-type branched-subunit amino acid transport system ATPase component